MKFTNENDPMTIETLVGDPLWEDADADMDACRMEYTTRKDELRAQHEEALQGGADKETCEERFKRHMANLQEEEQANLQAIKKSYEEKFEKQMTELLGQRDAALREKIELELREKIEAEFRIKYGIDEETNPEDEKKKNRNRTK